MLKPNHLNVITSFLFAIVARNGIKYDHWSGDIFIIQLPLSIYYHGCIGEKSIVYDYLSWADQIVAHMSTFLSIYEALGEELNRLITIYWLCLVYITFTFYGGYSSLPLWKGCIHHSFLHIASAIGIHCLQLNAYHKSLI